MKIESCPKCRCRSIDGRPRCDRCETGPYMQCRACGLRFDGVIGDSLLDVAERWNSRVQCPEAEALAEAVEAAFTCEPHDIAEKCCGIGISCEECDALGIRAALAAYRKAFPKADTPRKEQGDK